jgi:hypothetical protein
MVTKYVGDVRKIRKFGALEPGDDSVSLLDTTSKKYRILIYENEITEFDFRRYLFARQAKVYKIATVTYFI